MVMTMTFQLNGQEFMALNGGRDEVAGVQIGPERDPVGDGPLDFADVRTVMSEMGIAMMGSGSASGDKRAREAAQTALQSPLLEDINLSGARGILVNITAEDGNIGLPIPLIYGRFDASKPAV